MSSSAPAIDTSDMDPELARYLNRNYWQQRSEQGPAATTPSAPVATAEPKTSMVKTHEIVRHALFPAPLLFKVTVFISLRKCLLKFI